MTQTTTPEKLVSPLLPTIDPKEIADEQMRHDSRVPLRLSPTRGRSSNSRTTSEPDRTTKLKSN